MGCLILLLIFIFVPFGIFIVPAFLVAYGTVYLIGAALALVIGAIWLTIYLVREYQLKPVNQSKLEPVGDERHHPLGVSVSVGYSKMKIWFDDFPESDPDRVVARVLKNGKKVTHAVTHRKVNEHGYVSGKSISIDGLEEGTPYEVQVCSPAGEGASFVRAEIETRSRSEPNYNTDESELEREVRESKAQRASREFNARQGAEDIVKKMQ